MSDNISEYFENAPLRIISKVNIWNTLNGEKTQFILGKVTNIFERVMNIFLWPKFTLDEVFSVVVLYL